MDTKKRITLLLLVELELYALVLAAVLHYEVPAASKLFRNAGATLSAPYKLVLSCDSILAEHLYLILVFPVVLVGVIYKSNLEFNQILQMLLKSLLAVASLVSICTLGSLITLLLPD